jgi:glutaredoxin
MKRSSASLIFGAVIVLVLVVVMFLLYAPDGFGEGEVQCIADNSVLYTSKTCSHCAAQKEILGDDLEKFTLVDCFYEQQTCLDKEIVSVPTWIIDGERYRGVRELNELKELTGC